MVGRTSDRATEKMGDALLENRVRLDADGIQHALGFKVVVNVRRGERRVATKVEADLPFLIAFDHRHQDFPPAVGTVDVAGAQTAPFKITHVVEQEQRMIAGAAEMAVVGRAFLAAVGRTDAGIHVEDHIPRWFTVVDLVDPCTGQVREGHDVVVGGQELGLEASHLTCRCRLLGDGTTANDPSHRRITPETLGVVHVLIAAETTEGALPE